MKKHLKMNYLLERMKSVGVNGKRDASRNRESGHEFREVMPRRR